MRYFIHLSYNGAAYHGWQLQDNADSVQQRIAESLQHLLHRKIDIIGCGRTDTGVHAKNFYAHFDYCKRISAEEIEKLLFKLNRFLPEDIAVFSIRAVKDDAHARFSPISREYKYYLITKKDAFWKDYAYYQYGDIDIKKMNKAAEKLLHHSDFTSFSKSRTQTKTNNCTILYALWTKEADNRLCFTIKADRFLRNMVRAIAGTLLDVGIHKISVEEFVQIIESKSRSNAGYSVPAKALFLTEVEYPKDIYIDY